MRRARAVATVLVAVLTVPAGGRAAEVAARGRLGPEVPIAQPVVVPARGDEQAPDVAAGDGGFLAVWEDDRYCCSTTIRAARLDRDGEPLDLFGIPVSTREVWSDDYPTAAWNGTDYVVAWRSNSAIEVARVSPEGEVADVQALPRHENAFASPADVASTGNGALLVWSVCGYHGGDCESDLYGALLEPDGRLRGPLLLAGDPGSVGAPSVAADAGGYLVTWGISNGPDRGLYTMRVHADGSAAGAPVLVAAGNYLNADVAFGGDHFLAVWQTDIDDGLDVQGIRLDRDGAPLDAQPVMIAFGRPIQEDARVAPDEGGGYYVVWQERGRTAGVFGTRVTGAGEVARTNGVRVARLAGGDWEPAIAFDGSTRLVVWRTRRRSSVDVYGVARRPDEPHLREPRPVATGLNVQSGAATAWNGRVFLVVWEDSRETSWPYDVYAARVTPSGRVLDGAGFKVSSSTSIVGSPAVASDGRDFFVAWEDWRNHRKGDRRADLYGARVLADGTVAETGIPISTARDYQQYVRLAWTGTSYLAAWEDLRSGETRDSADHADVYATAITRRGVVSSPGGRVVAAGRRNHGAVDVAADGGDALVAWTEGCDAWRNEDCRRDVFARRLSATARRLGKTIPVATRAVSESYPAVTAGPRGYHVVWTRKRESRLTLVGKTLTAGARPTVLHRFESEAFGASLDWAGPYGLLTWTEGNSDFGDGDDMDAYALRLSADGRPLDAQPLPVSTDAEPDFGPDVTAGPRGCAVISFGRFYQSTHRGVRSFLRFLGGCTR